MAVTDRAVEGSPTLVVEVLSPSTSTRDRNLKAERYAALTSPRRLTPDRRLSA